MLEKKLESKINALLSGEGEGEVLSGSSMAQIRKFTCEGHRFLLKQYPGRPEIVKSEVRGLEELRLARGIRVPAVFWHRDDAFVMEYIAGGTSQMRSGAHLAEALLSLHDIRSELFGFQADNHLGRSPQRNTPCQNKWGQFFVGNRLDFQLRLLEKKYGLWCPHVSEFRGCYPLVEEAIDQGSPQPSLVHGDLWSGNVMFDDSGRAVLIDPAVYYGDPWTDIAMAKLFGGFDADFFKAYESLQATPVTPFKIKVYQLYHLLNHCNLFGKSYFSSTCRTIQDLVKQLA